MKTTLIALTAIAALTFTPRSAHALGDKEAALLGGLLGGAIIGAALDDAFDNKHHRSSVRYGGRNHSNSYGRSYGHHDHGPACGCNSCRSIRNRHNSGGYWTYRDVKVWVPGRTSYYYDACGRRVSYCTPGYWTYRKEKVWVSNRGNW